MAEDNLPIFAVRALDDGCWRVSCSDELDENINALACSLDFVARVFDCDREDVIKRIRQAWREQVTFKHRSDN
jgi:hypothetical protein